LLADSEAVECGALAPSAASNVRLLFSEN
jgi:hypothetical protein